MKKKVNVLNILARYAIILALVLLVIVFWSSSDTFFTENNIFNIFKQVAVVGIVSVGMTMVLLTGGIDLSVGSTIGVACVLTATLLLAGVNAILAVIISPDSMYGNRYAEWLLYKCAEDTTAYYYTRYDDFSAWYCIPYYWRAADIRI